MFGRFLLATVGAVAALIGASPAFATTAYVGPSGLVVTAHAGEANRLSVTGAAVEYLVSEGGGVLITGAGCTRVARASAVCIVPATAKTLTLDSRDAKDIVTLETEGLRHDVDTGDHGDMLLGLRADGIYRLGVGPDTMDLRGFHCGWGVNTHTYGISGDFEVYYPCEGTSDTEVHGGEGADQITVGDQPRLVMGNPGDDVITLPYSSGTSAVNGGPGNDTLSAFGTLYGMDGDDRLQYTRPDPPIAVPCIACEGPPSERGEVDGGYGLIWYAGAGNDSISRIGETVYCGDGYDTVTDNRHAYWYWSPPKYDCE